MKNTITLETERLILRKLEENDYKAIYENWASDKDVARYVTWNAHENNDVTKELVYMWLDDYKNEYTFRWIVTLKEDGTPIGMIDVVNKNIADNRAEIGYVYGKKWWGNGYATEALKKVIEYVTNSGFELITAKHLKSNPASGKVMEKTGMKHMATLKLYSKNKEKVREDVEVYYYYKN